MDQPAPASAAPRRVSRFGFLQRRRFWLLAVPVLLAPVVASLPYLSWQFETKLIAENIHQIELGMTQAEVEALLGGPPGHYRGAGRRFQVVHTVIGGKFVAPAPSWRSDRVQDWFGDEFCVSVYFYSLGRASHKDLTYMMQLTYAGWYEDRLVYYWPGSRNLIQLLRDAPQRLRPDERPERYRPGS